MDTIDLCLNLKSYWQGQPRKDVPALTLTDDLLILDDLSYVRRDQAETSVLFELIAAYYERKRLLSDVLSALEI